MIRFYGDSMQMLVPRYLEQSMQSFTGQQDKFREKMAQAFGGVGLGAMEDQVRRNMEMFEKTFAMFAPFARGQGKSAESEKPASGGGNEMDELKRQLDEMQKRLDKLGAPIRLFELRLVAGQVGFRIVGFIGRGATTKASMPAAGRNRLSPSSPVPACAGTEHDRRN